jgi:D-glycero-alpha-D-manno-heptose-7-phosphate kinase
VASPSAPIRTVHATAPVRICDIGGWTDTWFAGHGAVFHMAVTPGVEVGVRVHGAGAGGRVSLEAVNGSASYSFDVSDPPGRQPLLEATIAEVGVAGDVSVEIAISSGVPSGSATGTSAAVTVALIGALDLVAGRTRTPPEVATLAHRVETERLGHESGVQDQACAAYGGINYIEIPSYPETRVTQLAVPDAVWGELDRRLVLVSLGRPHVSSALHERVIARLGADRGSSSAELEVLRGAATEAKAAVEFGDLERLGRAMVENTDAQARLHPDLVNADAHRLIRLAATHGAMGWKVNGAGGDGGSVTLLCGPDAHAKQGLLEALRRSSAGFEVIPICLSRDGLRAWES